MAQSFQHEQAHFGQASSYFVQLPEAVLRSRDHMVRSLQSVGLRPVIPQGSYFLIADISDFSECDWPGWARGGVGGGEALEGRGLEAAQGSAWLPSPREQDA